MRFKVSLVLARLLISMCLGALVLATWAAPAVADTSFAGTVTAVGGGPLNGIEVQTYSWDVTGSVWVDGPFTTTSSDGGYSVSASDTPEAAPFGWIVGFSDPTSGHFAQFYQATSSQSLATTLAAGVAHTGIDAAMQRRPSVYGRVYSAVALSGIDGATVTLYEDSGAGFTATQTAITSGGGFYSFYGLPDGGIFRLGASAPSHDPLFWDGKPTLALADDVVITQGVPVADVDFGLVSGSTPAPASVVRLSGKDRYAVAAAVARDARPGLAGVRDIVIASGEDRAAADPLAAAGLCWAHGGAPLLLLNASGNVRSSTVDVVADAVKSNGTVTLRVVGGTTTLPASRLKALRSAVAAKLKLTSAQATSRMPIDRVLSGGDRYDMAAEIAREMKRLRSGTATVFFANGADSSKFFDALSASAVSAGTGAPVLLVSRDSIPAATLKVLGEIGVPDANRYSVGGPATISSAVLTKLGVAPGHRLGGADRYAVAVNVAETGVSMSWFLASGRQAAIAGALPDALAGGAAVGSAGGPMLLTAPRSLPKATRDHLVAEKSRIARCMVLGGTNSVSSGVETEIRNALQ